jgi:hypothetical protein
VSPLSSRALAYLARCAAAIGLRQQYRQIRLDRLSPAKLSGHIDPFGVAPPSRNDLQHLLPEVIAPIMITVGRRQKWLDQFRTGENGSDFVWWTAEDCRVKRRPVRREQLVQEGFVGQLRGNRFGYCDEIRRMAFIIIEFKVQSWNRLAEQARIEME